MAKAKKVGYAAYRLTPLQEITKIAKGIRDKSPNMKYTDAIKKASAIYRGEKKTPAKASPKKVVKKAAPKKAAPKKKVAKRKVSGIGETGKRTAAVNNSVENLRKYAEFIKAEQFAKNAIEYNRTQLKMAKDAKTKKRINYSIAQLQKTLKVIQRQKAMQKSLI